MNITTTPAKIGGESVQTVNARDLHTNLNVHRKFSEWIKVQIQRADLVEGEDFCYIKGSYEPCTAGVYHVVGEAAENLGGRPSEDYHLTIDAAKNIALMSNTARGKEVRKYFIEVEKKYRAEQHLAQPKPVFDVLEWLDPANIAYFGGTGVLTAERRYFALLEAKVLGTVKAAEKYDIEVGRMRELRQETSDYSLAVLGEAVARFNPVKCIKADIAHDEAKRQQKETNKLRGAKRSLTMAKKKVERLEYRSKLLAGGSK